MVFKAKKKPKKKQEVEEELEEEIEEDVDEADEEEEKPAEKISKSDETWIVQEMPTQTTPVIYNIKTKKPYDLLSAIVELLNRTEE